MRKYIIVSLVFVFLFCVSSVGVDTTYSVDKYIADSIQSQIIISEPEPFEGKVYELDRIVDVIDGDTIKIEILDDDWIKEDKISIRLMGVNCFEKHDQTSWLEARRFTKDFLVGSNRVEDKEVYLTNPECDYRMMVIKRDGERLLAFIVRYEKGTYQEGGFFEGEDLSNSLIEAGYGIPAIFYSIHDHKNKYNYRTKLYVESALGCYNNPPKGDTIWGMSKLSNELDIEIEPNKWMSRNKDDDGYEIYTFTQTLVRKDSKGESIFLRDPNRKIVDWVYWNGEETVTPDKIIEHLQELSVSVSAKK